MTAGRNGAHAAPSSRTLSRPGRSPLPSFTVETVDLASLTPHPRNYQVHPDDELDQLEQSLRDHGIYRNVVVAKDGTILAGHGVVQAATRMGLKQIPVRRMPYKPTDPRALKILAADNEIPNMAERDLRALSELLRDVRESDKTIGLLGTGFDDMMLANLVFVSRPSEEIADKNAAAQWVGLPEYQDGYPLNNVTVHFLNDKDRAAFAKLLGLDPKKMGRAIHFPARPRDDLESVKFTVAK